MPVIECSRRGYAAGNLPRSIALDVDLVQEVVNISVEGLDWRVKTADRAMATLTLTDRTIACSTLMVRTIACITHMTRKVAMNTETSTSSPSFSKP